MKLNLQAQCFKPTQKIKDHYIVLRKISDIQYGAIYELFDSKFNEVACCKILEKQQVTKIKNAETNFILELSNMTNFQHSSIIKFIEEFEDENCFFIILERFDKLLLQWKAVKKVFLEEELTNIIKQIVLGLQEIHNNGLYHGNLNMNSLVFVEEGQIVKITDFSISKNVEINLQWSHLFYLKIDEKLDESILIAPEVLQFKIYQQESDLYSLGLILYNLAFSQEIPFKGNTLQEQKKSKLEGQINFDFPKLQIRYSQNLHDLIQKLLNPDPQKRIKLNQILGHPLFSPLLNDKNTNQKEVLEQIKIENNIYNTFMNKQIYIKKNLSKNSQNQQESQTEKPKSTGQPASQQQQFNQNFQQQGNLPEIQKEITNQPQQNVSDKQYQNLNQNQQFSVPETQQQQQQQQQQIPGKEQEIVQQKNQQSQNSKSGIHDNNKIILENQDQGQQLQNK